MNPTASMVFNGVEQSLTARACSTLKTKVGAPEGSLQGTVGRYSGRVVGCACYSRKSVFLSKLLQNQTTSFLEPFSQHRWPRPLRDLQIPGVLAHPWLRSRLSGLETQHCTSSSSATSVRAAPHSAACACADGWGR